MEHLELPVKSADPLQGAGVPDNSFGSDGNLYIDTNDGKMYYKVAGVWYESAANPIPAPTQSLQAAFNGGSGIVQGDITLDLYATGAAISSAVHINCVPQDAGGGEAFGNALLIDHAPDTTSSDFAVVINANSNSGGGLRVVSTGGTGATYLSTSSFPGQYVVNSGTGEGLRVQTNVGTGDAAVLRAKASAAHIKLEAQTSGSISLKVPATVTAHSLTLPAGQGVANSFLHNNGSGDLGWIQLDSSFLSDFQLSGYPASSNIIQFGLTHWISREYLDLIVTANSTAIAIKNTFNDVMLHIEGSIGGNLDIGVPANFTSYALTLPIGPANADEVLADDGTGQLYWGAVEGFLYTPTTLADWSNIAPASIKDALDRIASTLGPIL